MVPMTRTDSPISAPVSEGLTRARASFDAGRGFLAVASIGIPTRETVAALKHDLDLWAAARRDPQHYDPVIERTRASFAELVGVAPDRVAIGSQTSVMTSVVAAAVPRGAEVVVAHGDFSSIVFPFLEQQDISVRSVPIDELADAIDENTWLAVFSHVQSATGQVADVSRITAAAARYGAFTFCDTTQSAGVHPVDASLFDVSVCHAYKWLCSPRGVGFLTVSERMEPLLAPIQAGWYAGEDVWRSCYGPDMLLASNARRFDVSPAWPAWVGADPAIRMFADLDLDEVWAYTSGIGDALCDELGIERQGQPIVTWPDPDGSDLAKLIGAGIRASGRVGRLRASFHIWNDLEDVELVVKALR
jgi:selenocysteine lyase/cysteine desulfurase